MTIWSEEEVSQRRVPSATYFSRPGSAPWRIWPKNNNTSSHMLLDHFCAFGLLLWPSALKKKFLKAGYPPRPTFAPPWIRPLADLAEKQQHLCGTMSTSYLPSFITITHAVLEKRLNMCSHTYACMCATTPPPFLN